MFTIYESRLASNVCPYCKTPIESYTPPMTAPTPTTTGHRGIAAGGIKYETVASPAFTMLLIHLSQGQSIKAEAGAMMYMHPSI